jgi:MFS family permease
MKPDMETPEVREELSGLLAGSEEAAENEFGAPPSGWLALTFRSLRHRNYRLYFFGQLVSLTGTWMQTAALAWLAFKLTGRNQWPALVSACQLAPTFVLGAWGGRLADLLPKRTVLITTQSALLVLALVLAVIVALGLATPWLLVVISLLNGIVFAVDLPARLAFVMDMVGREDVINAVGLNSVLFNAARIVGPAFAGVMLRFWGASICFLANALSYLAVLWALLQIDAGLTVAAALRTKVAPSLRCGFAYLIERPELFVLVLLAAALSLFAWPVLALLPGMADHVLGVSEIGYTTMLIAVGIGALTAASTVAGYASVARQRVFIAVGLCSVTAGLLGLSLATQLAVAVCSCALIGFGLIMYLSTSQGIVQLGASEHNRGLIMGIWAMVQTGGLPLGNMLAGPAADYWGPSFTFRVQGLLCGAASLALVVIFGRRQAALSNDIAPTADGDR